MKNDIPPEGDECGPIKRIAPSPKPTQGAEKGTDWALLAIRALSEYTEHDRGLDKTYADLIRPYAPLAEPAQAGRTDTERLDLLFEEQLIIVPGLKLPRWACDTNFRLMDREDVDAAMSPSAEDKK